LSGKIVVCLLSFFTFSVNAQQMLSVDSLDRIIQSEKETEKKVGAMTLKARIIGTNDPAAAIQIGKEALRISRKLNYKKGIYDSYRNIGVGHTFRSEYEPAVAYLDSAEKIAQQIPDPKATAEALLNFGGIYLQFGKFDKSLTYYIKATKAFGDLKDSANLTRCYNNLGNVFYYLGKLPEAADNYNMAAAYAEKRNDVVMLVRIYNALAVIEISKKDYDKTLGYFQKAIKINEKVGDKQMEAGIYNNMASVCVEQKKFSEAILLFNKYREKALELGDKKGVANAYGSMGEVYRQMSDYDNAIMYFKLQFAIADSIKINKQKMVAEKGLWEVYKAKGNYREAHDALEQYMIFKDSVDKETMNKNIASLTERLENEKKEKERELRQAALDAEHAAEIRKQRIIIYSVIIALVLALGIVYQVFRNFSQKKKANVELEKKNRIIEEKQKEIIDSINYAKRIQHTLLAHTDFLNLNIPHNFVYFHPKDIVSGDFYWAAKHKDRFYLAVCDSTGHGVPGAFMSLLNMGFLNEAIKEKQLEEPNQVFDHVRERLITSISNEGQKDGMDGILLCIDQKNKTIEYCAANNEPVLVQDGKLVELPKDKMPVGKGEKTNSFTLHKIDYKSGDHLYLYTDGFADQFGGPKGKKFMYKKLNELLVSISTKPLSEQSALLTSTFNAWKGDLEQVDDVCIIGIRM
jgi:serine phosphatase RsbU (regulator of sigma subunit)